MSAVSSTRVSPGVIAVALFAHFSITAMSLCVRLAAKGAPVGQIVFFRSGFALVPILLYLAWRGQLPNELRTRRVGGHIRRSLLGAAAMFFSFVSIAHLPLAVATALGFLAPLIALPLAIAFLKERPGWIVAAAALAGFAGVALMLSPSMDGPGFDRGVLIGIGAGLGFAATSAIAKIQIKALTSTEAPGAIAFYFALVGAVASLATAPFGWILPDPQTLAALIAAGLFGGLAHIAATEAVARAPVSRIAPFEYTAMLWALLFDAAVFGLIPTPLVLLGAGVVVVAAAAAAIAGRRNRPATGKTP